jgi:hypothetical protein
MKCFFDFFSAIKAPTPSVKTPISIATPTRRWTSLSVADLGDRYRGNECNFQLILHDSNVVAVAVQLHFDSGFGILRDPPS